MKLCRELRNIGGHPFVFTGNGRRELKVLSAICARFDGDTRLLWFPSSPIKPGLKQTGITVLNALVHAIETYGLGQFLCLLDREHFATHIDEPSQVCTFLNGKKASVYSVTCLVPARAFVFQGCLSGRHFELCLVVLGTTSSLEEEISELIRLVHEIDVSPDKAAIEQFLSVQGCDVRSLIGSASMEHLATAFPGLCSAMKWIERENS